MYIGAMSSDLYFLLSGSHDTYCALVRGYRLMFGIYLFHLIFSVFAGIREKRQNCTICTCTYPFMHVYYIISGLIHYVVSASEIRYCYHCNHAIIAMLFC